MALTIVGVHDYRAVLGISRAQRAFQLQPALSDYPTGGYQITAAQLGLGNLYGAKVIAGNAAAALFTPKFVLPSGSFSATNPSPATSINMIVTVADVQEGANTDLSACEWFVEFEAQGE